MNTPINENAPAVVTVRSVPDQNSCLNTTNIAPECPGFNRPDPAPGNELMTAALDLAGCGFAVFPCRTGGKEPITMHGCKDASSDTAQVSKWWLDHPTANIGIATGGSSGICVIDIDNKGGKNGSAVLEELEVKHGRLPETYTVKTPTGGFHLYYKGKLGIRNSTDKLGSGLDTRGDGGYVIAAGSSIGGINYEVVKELPIASLPEWVTGLLNPPHRKEITLHKSSFHGMSVPDETKVVSALEHLDPDCGYDDWFKIGMALHSWNASQGLELWDGWSSKSSKYREGECESKWSSFKGDGGITVASLLDMAMKNGWRVEREKDFPIVKNKSSENNEYIDDKGNTALQAEFFKIHSTKGLSANERYKLMAEASVAAIKTHGKLFHNSEFKNFETCMFFNSLTRRLTFMQSDEFQSWLATFAGINRAESAYKYIYDSILDECLIKSPGIVPEKFWAGRGGATYMSCGAGHIVKVTPGKYEMCDNGTDNILFLESDTLPPWKMTEPRDPFTSCRVFSNMSKDENCDYANDLLKLWTLALPTNQRTKPVIVLTGDIGSGKTRLAVAIFELLGIQPRIHKLDDGAKNDSGKAEDNFWCSLNAGGLTCFDNVDTRIKWLPDALAAASTNGSKQKRRNYENGETSSQMVNLRANSWIILTSMNPAFAEDSGLADRILVIRVKRREGETLESELSADITATRDAGLSWICQTLSKVLADANPVKAGLNKRHPDFATFAIRAGRALGRETESIKALTRAEQDKHLFNLENCDIGTAILSYVNNRGSFTGTAAELKASLIANNPDFDGTFWTTKKIAKSVSKIWPHLAEVLKIKQGKGHDGIITYSFKNDSSLNSVALVALESPFPINPQLNPSCEVLVENTLSKPPNPPISLKPVWNFKQAAADPMVPAVPAVTPPKEQNKHVFSRSLYPITAATAGGAGGTDLPHPFYGQAPGKLGCEPVNWRRS